jgi:nitrate/nitrite transporter NarK
LSPGCPDYLVTVRHFTILRAGFFSSLPYFVFGASEPLGGWIADRLTATVGTKREPARES